MTRMVLVGCDTLPSVCACAHVCRRWLDGDTTYAYAHAVPSGHDRCSFFIGLDPSKRADRDLIFTTFAIGGTIDISHADDVQSLPERARAYAAAEAWCAANGVRFESYSKRRQRGILRRFLATRYTVDR